MEIIELPVSLGEAIDKLTILDIKKDKIIDDRIVDVLKEYELLYEKLKEHIIKLDFYYKILKQINLDIWEMQDNFRYSNGDKNELCIKIIEENDRRFRVKKKINELTNSALREQKGYRLNKAFVLTHLGLGDNITAIGMVRYLATLYDKVVVVVKKQNKENLELFYADDKSIELYAVNEDKEISPNYGFDRNEFLKITENYSLYLCGFHNLEKTPINYSNIPFSFYEQINIHTNVFWNYFYIPALDEYNKLYSKIENKKYIFVHNQSSNGEVFNIRFIENKFNLNKNDIMFINPCVNSYQISDKYYEQAQEFIGYKLVYYSNIIKNAEYNFFSDSSFMCLAINLNIKTNNNYYYSRNNRNYDHIYSEKYIFKNVNRKIFN